MAAAAVEVELVAPELKAGRTGCNSKGWYRFDSRGCK